MDTWMLFESGEAEYLQRIRNENRSPLQRQTGGREPGRLLRERLAAALVALARRLAPAMPTRPSTDIAPARIPQ